MTILITASPLFIPQDILFDMLSNLPVKSLVRFRCACKHWNSITLDFQFMLLHYKRSPLLIYKERSVHDQCNEFEILCSEGLLLERTTQFPFELYRIRNPHLHQILELPDSLNPSLKMDIFLDLDYQVLKLLSAVYLFGNKSVLGYEVLDLRNEENITYSWRPLTNLHEKSRGGTRMWNQISKYSYRIMFCFAMGIAYSMWSTLSGSHIGIDILDMVNDSYIGHTTLPKDYYTVDDYLIWNGKLSFGKIVKEELHVLVLDDYEKQKWAERKLIIKLAFMNKVVQDKHITVCRVQKSKLYFHRWDLNSYCTYDITTGKVTTILYGYSKAEFATIPCLFGFKGSDRNSVIV